MSLLLRAWTRPLGRVELHITPDVVGFTPNGRCDFLLYGANEALSGPLFTPTQANARLAGNSVRGRGLIYPEQSVDGQVSESGGLELRRLLGALPARGDPPVRCAQGSAVRTAAAGTLLQSFSELLHACPPQFERGEPASSSRLLLSCWLRAFDLAWRRAGSPALASVASPLLGAGARGFSLGGAAEVLADAVRQWAPASGGGAGLLCIAVQDEDAAEAVCAQMGRHSVR